MNVKEYQLVLKNRLFSIYSNCKITTEWCTRLSQNQAYSPRIDVAVGPFATEERFIDIYDQMYDNSKSIKLLNIMYDYHCKNLEVNKDIGLIQDLKYFNTNARCFMGVEIENQVSAKHLLGGIVNVSALSRVGILVPWNPSKHRVSKRMMQYFKFLKGVGKNTFDTKNVFILTSKQLLAAIDATMSE